MGAWVNHKHTNIGAFRLLSQQLSEVRLGRFSNSNWI
ncbi:Uncharacterised protein [Vibrio cholerae]|nr:Uncharacterised protein [Vibrio cholerae]